MFKVTAKFLKKHNFSPTFPARFFSKIRFTKSCWLWTSPKANTGYGQIGSGKRKSKLLSAHVASWILHFGKKPAGLFVCHDCPDGDQKLCVNPAHLWLGTTDQNMKDAANKGRTPKGERHGRAKLTNKQIKEIRSRRMAKMKHAEIARIYGVGRENIGMILRGKTWKHVTHENHT
jgi:hypothetical protein